MAFIPPYVEKWLVQCLSNQDRGLVIADQELVIIDTFAFSFSPLSARPGTFALVKHRGRQLGTILSFSSKILYEVKGDRERRRMEYEWEVVRTERGENPVAKIGPDQNFPGYDAWWNKYYELEDTPDVWPMNQQCVRNVFLTILALFPVFGVKVDEPLGIAI